MIAMRILLSRWRVMRAKRLIRRGRAILDREERRWGLVPLWRVPNVTALRH